MSFVAAKSSTFLCGTPLKAAAPRPRAARAAVPTTPRAKYGDADQYFDLDDLEDTVGSWDMYGQQDSKRYPGLQNEFFERAGTTLSRREAMQSLLALGGFGAFALFGLKGSTDINLPIVAGPKGSGEKGPKGKI